MDEAQPPLDFVLCCGQNGIFCNLDDDAIEDDRSRATVIHGHNGGSEQGEGEAAAERHGKRWSYR